jgi:uncharacterized protein HemY
MPRTRPRSIPVTPGVPKPARELYGVMLLERGKPGSARRLRGDAEEGAEPARRLCGRAKAAEKSGDTAKARRVLRKVVAIAGDADKTRTEVSEARTFSICKGRTP